METIQIKIIYFLFCITPMIIPEEEETNKISIPMQNVHDKIIKKRKRRYVYYFLCILLSFVCIRVFLVMYSISQLDPKSHVFKQIKYNTDNPNSVFLDVSLQNAFSPLNAQIIDGVVNLYCVNSKANKRDLLAQIHLPVIELEKYKNLQFKGDLVFSNVDGGVLYNLLKNRHKIGIYFTGNLWFRFFLIKFKKSQTNEFLFDLSISSEEKKDYFYVKKTELKSKDDNLELKVQLDCLYPSICDYLYVQTENIQIEFGGDLPFIVDISSQDIFKGRFLNPLEFSIFISKGNYFILRNTLCKFLNNSKIFLCMKDFSVPSHNKKNFPIKFYLHEFFSRRSFLNKKKTTCKYKEPLIDVREIFSHENKIISYIDINPGYFPLVSQETKFVFNNIEHKFNFMLNGTPGASLRLKFKTSNEYIRLEAILEINRFQDFLEIVLYQKSFLNIVSKSNTGFFKNISLMWDKESIRLNIERSYTILYERSRKKNSFDRILDIYHHINSNDNTILISSELINNYEDENQKFVFFCIPDFKINIESEIFSARLEIRESNVIVYEDFNFDGILRTDLYIYVNPNINFIEDYNLIDNTTIKINILSDCQSEISINDIIKKIDPSKRSEYKIFNLKDIILDYIDMLDLSKGKMAFNLRNKTSLTDYTKSGFIIRNFFDIDKNHGLTLLIGARKYPYFRHLELIENMKFNLLVVNGIPSILIDKCKFSFDINGIDNLRGLFLDKFSFGRSDTILSSLLGQFFNYVLFSKGNPSKQIISSIILDGQVDTDISNISDRRTKINFKLGLDYDIINNFKLAEFNFGRSNLIFETINGKNICQLEIYKDFNIQGSFIVLNLDILNNFYKSSLAVFTYSYNGYKKETINNYYPDTFMRLIRSFFVQLHVKDKIKLDKETKKTLSTLNVFYDNLKFDSIKDEFITFDGSLGFHSQGFKDLIRYKLASYIAIFFNTVPDKFVLTLKSNRFDLISVKFYENIERSKYFVFGQSHLENVYSHKSFKMLYDGGSTDVLKSNDESINLPTFLSEKSENRDLYCINIKYKAFIKANPGRIFSIYHLSLTYETIELFSEILKDDMPCTISKCNTTSISEGLCEKCIYCGFNLRIVAINSLKLKITGNNHIIYNNSFIESQIPDGYIRINIKSLSIPKSFYALTKILWNYKDFEVELYTENGFNYKVQFKPEFITVDFVLSILQKAHKCFKYGWRWFVNYFFNSDYGRNFIEIEYAKNKNLEKNENGVEMEDGYEID